MIYTLWEFTVFNKNVARLVECSFYEPDEKSALRRISVACGKEDLITVCRTDVRYIIPLIQTKRVRCFDLRVTGYNTYEKIRLHIDSNERLPTKSYYGIGAYVAAIALLTYAFFRVW